MGVNVVGKVMYGERFIGFDKLEGIRDLIPGFKEYYYDQRIKKGPKETMTNMLRGFNEMVAYPQGRTFHPYVANVQGWRNKWDKDIAEKMALTGNPTTEAREIMQLVKTRDDDRNLVEPPQLGDIESGLHTLGGELLNDAMQLLRDDQEQEEFYDDETLIKRRNYIVNVFSHVTKLVHGKAALLLKASEEKRNNAGFLMTLLAKASSGKLSDEEMGALRTTYSPPVTVQSQDG